MGIPVTFYVDATASLESSGVAGADFNVPIFLNENAIAGSVLQGPYSSSAAVIAAGFASGSAMHDYAVMVEQQTARPATFYSGKVDSGGGLGRYRDAAEAARLISPGAFYGVNCESRDPAEVLLIASWAQSNKKLAAVQSGQPSMVDDTNGLAFDATFGATPEDGDYDLIFTGFGLVSPVTVTVARSTTPDTNDDLAAAMDAELDTAAGGGGDLEDILQPDSIESEDAVVSFAIADGLIGTVTSSAPGSATLTVEVTDGDLASQLFALQYTRAPLFYNSDDSVLLAEAVMCRCFGNDLDVAQLSWDFKKLIGIVGSTLNETQVAVLRNANANYFATTITSAGQESVAFTAPGWTSNGPSGQGLPIRVTTSTDWMLAKWEERVLNMHLREPDAVWLDDDGLNRLDAIGRSIAADGLAANHFIGKVVPEGELYAGTETPAIFVPKAKDLTTEERETGTVTVPMVVYIKPSLAKTVVNVKVRL